MVHLADGFVGVVYLFPASLILLVSILFLHLKVINYLNVLQDLLL